MRTLLLITFITLYTVTNSDIVHAQEKSDSTSISDSSFLFQIGSNFNLTNFNGATFAFQKMVDEETANRFYISLNGEYSTGDQDVDRFNSRFNQGGTDTVRVQDFENNSNDDFFINSTVGWIRLKYRSFNDDIRYYGGFGLALSYSYVNRSETMNDEGTYYSTGNPLNENAYQRDAELRRHVFGVGPLFISGVEYGLTDHLYLLAEYGFQVRYEREIEDSKISLEAYQQSDLVEFDSGDADRTTNAVIFDSFPVRFGLRVNF